MSWLWVAFAAPVLAGFPLQRRGGALASAAAWSLGGGAVVLAEVATRGCPPFPRMLALVGTLLLAMKAVASVASRSALPLWRWLLFCAWAGMDPRTFANRAPRAGATALARDGLRDFALGLALLAAAWVAPRHRLASECALFVASSLIVHFGLFALLAAALRRAGFPAERLFRAPWRARSLAEFWGQRWNLGFAELTALAVHRPLRARLGPMTATTAAYLFSGLLHEIAITVPVRAGYGGPLGYFALQAVAVLLERRCGLHGRAWTFACLLLPVPLLFPPEFRAMVARALLP